MKVRSGILTAWASAWLAGEAAFDDAVSRVTGADEPHRLVGLPGTTDEVPLGWLLPVLRERAPEGLRLVLPVPGDPRGLPGPGPFSTAALECGEAVMGGGFGAVPRITSHGSTIGSRTTSVCWVVFETGEPTPDPLTVAEAEHALTDATRDAASTLAALDVATWRPEVAGGLAKARRVTSPELPPGHDTRAVRLLAQADRLGAVLALASTDALDGTLTSREAAARDLALRPLATAVRRARLAAYNSVSSRRH